MINYIDSLLLLLPSPVYFSEIRKIHDLKEETHAGFLKGKCNNILNNTIATLVGAQGRIRVMWEGWEWIVVEEVPVGKCWVVHLQLWGCMITGRGLSWWDVCFCHSESAGKDCMHFTIACTTWIQHSCFVWPMVSALEAYASQIQSFSHSFTSHLFQFPGV